MVDQSLHESSGGHTTSSSGATSSTSEGTTGGSALKWMTPAEKKFLDQQTRRQTERILQKASKSHKQRVEEFNTHLENLTEHYDIPKVSWTNEQVVIK
ncbi:unnamed protein product [Oppiella nova]|uniref:Protein FAM32A n=1 Tax=Oppiella nova TaxID=334625 RepID=A0A7R9MR02_9ACAR|nr:unnamed protein product [Oppiella nova]CAG2181181.1 unnamed protein product [Oppiella nova]